MPLLELLGSPRVVKPKRRWWVVVVVVYDGWLDGWDVKLVQIQDRRQRRRQGVIYIPPRASTVRPVVLDRLLELNTAGIRSREKITKRKGKRKEMILGGVHDGGTGSTTGADVSMPSRPPYERSYGQMCSQV